MNMIDKDFDFSKIPYTWAMCYLSECSRRDECLRYQVCMSAGFTLRQCVLPAVLRKGECPYFHPIRKVRVAIGFKGIFSEVRYRDHSTIRSKIANYLGRGGTYYRYRNGERALSPEQQEWIRQLFRRYGYTDEVVFDRYETIYEMKG